MTGDIEILETVDAYGNVTGKARRTELHGNPALLHRSVHVLIFNSAGELLLQKRSIKKDTGPGKWDSSVGGHVNPGESVLAAAIREMKEELGTGPGDIDYLYEYIFTGTAESELVTTFLGKHEGGFEFNKEEIDAVKFWDMDDIIQNKGQGIFTDNFEREIDTFVNHTGKRK